jgi:hypothetical protein
MVTLLRSGETNGEMTTNGLHYVKDLINRQESSWKSDIISSQFLSIDQESIYQIPIINTNIKDSVMWMHEQNGNYSVKSGYKAIREWQNQNSPVPSTSNSAASVWKKIWTLHTIPRHKNLLWRILNHSIPVRAELSKRGGKLFSSLS